MPKMSSSKYSISSCKWDQILLPCFFSPCFHKYDLYDKGNHDVGTTMRISWPKIKSDLLNDGIWHVYSMRTSFSLFYCPLLRDRQYFWGTLFAQKPHLSAA
eukprot:TRINITY_DN8971_c0_g3_i1.p1 TRINITY_DN8971_c0_g3~~TRINITY_DN8971_c0_g3_i1.p1  ORF type:complete len:101 (-),score=2.09 TRINITY_DN8971_c0_g3_i1:1699-2001(-)